LHTAHPLPRDARQPHAHSDAERVRGLLAAVFATAVAGLSIAACRVTASGLPYLVAGAIALTATFHIVRHAAAPDRSRTRAARGGTEVSGHALYLTLAATGLVVAFSPIAVSGARGGRPPAAPKAGSPGQIVQVSPSGHPGRDGGQGMTDAGLSRDGSGIIPNLLLAHSQQRHNAASTKTCSSTPSSGALGGSSRQSVKPHFSSTRIDAALHFATWA
jgi:hypothetical protein